MRRLRIRFTLWRTMALVAVVAVVLGMGIEVFVILPRERPRLEHAAMHFRVAEARSRQANTTSHQIDPKLRQELRDLSAWHRRRWDEIRKAPRFDPEAESWIDHEHQEKIERPIDDYYQQATRAY